MKAVVYTENGPPEVLRYADVPDPVCGPREVLVRVQAISIEGGDLGNRARGELLTNPHVVGYQCAGTVVEVGADVDDRAIDDDVVCVMIHGSHAELVAVDAGFTWIVPDGLDLVRAACVPVPFGTADDCLFEFGHLRAAEHVLVQAGGGGVGIAAVQLAHRAGATVFATASADWKLERLGALGLDQGINYREVDFVAEARRLTGGRGVDLVVDSVGATLAGSIASLAYRGRCITVGDASRAQAAIDVAPLRGGNQSLTGVFLGAEMLMARDRAHAMIARHLAAIATGELLVVVDSELPLADAIEAHRRAESREAFGRVVMIP